MQKTKRKFAMMHKLASYSPDEISTIRIETLDVSQAVFANLLGISKQTVNSWECGWRTPSPMAMRFLNFAKKYPDLILCEIKLIGAKK